MGLADLNVILKINEEINILFTHTTANACQLYGEFICVLPQPNQLPGKQQEAA